MGNLFFDEPGVRAPRALPWQEPRVGHVYRSRCYPYDYKILEVAPTYIRYLTVHSASGDEIHKSITPKRDAFHEKSFTLIAVQEPQHEDPTPECRAVQPGISPAAVRDRTSDWRYSGRDIVVRWCDCST